MVALRFRLLLLAAVCAVFGGALGAPFHLDDFSLAASPTLTSPDGWKQLLQPMQTRPLTELSFWAQLQFTREPWAFRLFNLLLHLASVWLACGVLEGSVGGRAARIAAAVFAFHPLQTQAVVYVFARATLLAGFFCLASIRDWRQGRPWRAFAWFAAALLAKEEAVALPLVLALAGWAEGRLAALRAPLSAMAAVAAATGLRTIAAVSATPGSGAGAQSGFTPFEYFSFQGVAILRYLWLLLVPVGFTPEPAVRTGPWPASLAWGVIAVRALLSLASARKGPGFWLLAGLILLSPSSSVFPAAELAADRRMYLPLVFFGALAGLMLQSADRRLLVCLAALWAGASFFQARLWSRPQALWLEAVRLAPESVRAKRQLARLLPPRQAVEILQEAAVLEPANAGIQSDLGLAWLRAGDAGSALRAFGRALALEPDSAIHLHNRGLALLLLGQPDPAREDFERALDRDPCLFDALWNLRRLERGRIPAAGCRFTPEQRRLLFSGDR